MDEQMESLKDIENVKAVINVSRKNAVEIITAHLMDVFIKHEVADCPQYFVNISQDDEKFIQFIFAGEPDVKNYSNGAVTDLEDFEN